MKKQSNDYAEQYKNPKWQKLRLKILERDNWACQKCGDDKSQLQVHHRRYVYGNKVWEYHETDLITLCNECHETEKELMKEVMNQFLETLKISFFASEINELHCLVSHALYKSKYPPEVLLSAISWVVASKFEENIMDPYWKWLKSRGIKK